jgi:hypothetical protein
MKKIKTVPTSIDHELMNKVTSAKAYDIGYLFNLLPALNALMEQRNHIANNINDATEWERDVSELFELNKQNIIALLGI